MKTTFKSYLRRESFVIICKVRSHSSMDLSNDNDTVFVCDQNAALDKGIQRLRQVVDIGLYVDCENDKWRYVFYQIKRKKKPLRFDSVGRRLGVHAFITCPYDNDFVYNALRFIEKHKDCSLFSFDKNYLWAVDKHNDVGQMPYCVAYEDDDDCEA